MKMVVYLFAVLLIGVAPALSSDDKPVFLSM